MVLGKRLLYLYLRKDQCLCGKSGFLWKDISDLPVFERISNGIGYTFQITSIFVNLTVYENVALAIRKDNSNGEENSVSEVLSKVGLLDRIEQRSGDLSYGHQRLLELAMGMAQKPKLLILDEPTQGLSDSEIENFKKLIKDISSSTTILLIEHNMDVVMSIADNISVLHFGEIIADGDKETIQNDPIVQKAYLGIDAKVENLTSYYSNIKILKNLSFNLKKVKSYACLEEMVQAKRLPSSL